MPLITLDDILDAVPSRIRHGGMATIVRTFVKDVLGGVALGEHRTGGRGDPKFHLWAINGSAPEMLKLDAKWRAARYLRQSDAVPTPPPMSAGVHGRGGRGRRLRHLGAICAGQAAHWHSSPSNS